MQVFIKNSTLCCLTLWMSLFLGGESVLAQTAQSITSPTPGSTLTTSTVTFIGGHSSSEFGHSLWVGTTFGGNDLSVGALPTHSRTVSGLPSSGTIYVRYYTRIGPDPSDINDYASTNHTYTMNVGGGAPLTINPTSATVAGGGQQTFTGVGGTPPYTFSLVANTSSGASVNATTGQYTAGSTAGASTVRVTDTAGGTATATVTVQVSTSPFVITSPTPGSTLMTSTVTFIGGHSSNEFGHSLWVGTTFGGNDLSVGAFPTHSRTVSGLPSSGTIYVRYYTRIGPDPSDPNDYTSTEQTYTMNVGGGTPLTINPTSATVAGGGQQTFTGAGGTPPYTFSVVGDTTGGAGVNATTGQYTAGSTAGTSTVRVTDNAGATANATVTVTVNAPLTINPTSAAVTSGGQQTFMGAGGTPPYTFSLVANTSSGASVNPTTGQYTAGSTAGASTVRVTDTVGGTANAMVTVTVGGGVNVIPQGQMSVVSATSSGGDKVLDGNSATFWRASGSNPHEMILALGGSYNVSEFRYLPFSWTKCTQYEIYVSATNGLWGSPVAAGTWANDGAEKTASFAPKTGAFLRIHYLDNYCYAAEHNVYGSVGSGGGTPLTINPTSATVAGGGQQVFSGIGGTPPYTFSVVGDTTGGAGVNATTGQYTAGSTAGTSTVRVTDNAGATANATVTVTVNAPLTINPTSAAVTSGGQQTFMGAGGTPPYTFSLVANTSSGASVNPTTGQYTAGSTAGASTVRVTDTVGGTANAMVTVTVGGGVNVIPQGQMSVVSATSSGGDKVLDGNSATFWRASGSNPHEMILALGGSYNVSEFRYLPFSWTKCTQYEIYVSATNGLWGSPVAAGTWANDGAEKTASFAPKTGAFLRIHYLDNYCYAAEHNVYGSVGSGGGTPLTINPTSATVAGGGQQVFSGIGGTPPYTFSVVGDTTGGASVNATTGQYTAGSTAGTSTVRVTDSNLETTDAGITVQTPAALLTQAPWTVQAFSSQLSSARGAAMAIDGNPNTNWTTSQVSSASPPHNLEINLGNVFEIEGFTFLPRLPSQGIMTSFYEFYVSEDGQNWGEPVAAGEFAKFFTEKEVSFPRVPGQYVRIRPLGEHNGRNFIILAELNVMGAAFSGNFAPNGTITTPTSNVTINAGASVSFSGTFTDSNGDSASGYLWDFGDPALPDSTQEDPGSVVFPNPGTYTVTFMVTDSFGLTDPYPDSVTVKVLAGANTTLPRTNWSIKYVNSEEVILANNVAENVLDGNASTIWQTQFNDVGRPHEIQINLGSAFRLDALRYLPPSGNGRILEYHIYISPDGAEWGAPVAIGSFLNSSAEQRVAFPPKTGQFVRLVALTTVNANPTAAMAEVNLEGQCDTPFVELIEPLSQEVQAGPSLQVTASVCLAQPVHAGWGVRLSVGGQQQTIPFPSNGQITPTTFQRTFTGVSGDNLQVSAVIVNSGGNPVGGLDTSDSVTQVGIGDVYAGIGDSTTVGVGDDNDTDATSQDGRNTNTGRGFIPSLNNILTTKQGRPHDILNYGFSGESSAGALIRTPKILRERPGDTVFLIYLGINDAFSGMVPSGQGSSNPGPGTFKANLQELIDLLHDPSNGRRVYLAKVSFLASPFQPASTLSDLMAYNLAIDELVTSNGLTVTPPDLFTHFQANQQELAGDGIHPTGTGYKSMSTLWCVAITGGACPAP